MLRFVRLLLVAAVLGVAWLPSGHAQSGPPDELEALGSRLAELFAQGDYEEAEAIALQYVAAVRLRDGDDSAEFAGAIRSLGYVYRALHRYAEAEPLFRRALAIYEKLGPDHLAVASALNDLGLLYEAQRRYAEAEPLLRRALAIAETALGREHPITMTYRENLKSLLRARSFGAE